MSQDISPQPGAGDDGQFLVFVLADEEYAVDILRVQEIRRYSAITQLPSAASHVRGVINLRGTIVPVVDLRVRFGMALVDYTKFTVIVVVKVESKIVGLIVDAVSDVLSFQSTQIERAPELGGAIDTSSIAGMAKNGERLITLLNIDRALGVDGFSVAA